MNQNVPRKERLEEQIIEARKRGKETLSLLIYKGECSFLTQFCHVTIPGKETWEPHPRQKGLYRVTVTL
jgi:hypothetical protein